MDFGAALPTGSAASRCASKSAIRTPRIQTHRRDGLQLHCEFRRRLFRAPRRRKRSGDLAGGTLRGGCGILVACPDEGIWITWRSS